MGNCLVVILIKISCFFVKQKLAGTVDVLSLELIDFDNGKGISKVDLNDKNWPELYAEAQQFRVKLIEQLSDLDDDLAGKVITSESFDNVCSSDVVKAIQKATLNRVRFLCFACQNYD